ARGRSRRLQRRGAVTVDAPERDVTATREGEKGMDSTNWDDRYAQAPLLWSGGPDQQVAEAACGRSPGRALDLACGEGRNALWLADRDWRVTGVDFSAVALARAAGMAAGKGQAGTARLEGGQAEVRTYEPPPATDDRATTECAQARRPGLARGRSRLLRSRARQGRRDGCRQRTGGHGAAGVGAGRCADLRSSPCDVRPCPDGVPAGSRTRAEPSLAQCGGGRGS